MKRVAITGATGGLGQSAVDFMLAEGWEVVALGRRADAGAALARRGATFVALDLAAEDPAALAGALDNCDAVWHCAARSSPWGRAEDFVRDNVIATAALVAAAGEAGVRQFVHVSSPSVYFDYRNRFDVRETFRPVRYANHYAATKAAAEDVVLRDMATWPWMRCVLLRPRAIFGPHDRTLLPRLLRLARAAGGFLPLPRAGKVLMDMTYSTNVVHAMWLATTLTNLEGGAVFNITNHEPVYLDEVVQLLSRHRGEKMRILRTPRMALDAAARLAELAGRCGAGEPALTRYGVGALGYDMTLSNARALNQLRYRPLVSMHEALSHSADWC